MNMETINYDYIENMIKKYRELIIEYGILSKEACGYITKHSEDKVFVENACKLFNWVMLGGDIAK